MKQQALEQILALLDQHYPQMDRCYLTYDTPWQLLFATILSAQCTDDRVNMVTKDLFEKYKTLEDFANAEPLEMENDVRSTGFYRNKARHIIQCAQNLVEKYNGAVPSELETLVQLPGVGRKTANLIRGHIYQIPSIVVDTHVRRVSGKLGLTRNTDPEKVEYDLMQTLPQSHWIRYNQQIIAHGRAVCTARKPACADCFLNGLCEWPINQAERE